MPANVRVMRGSLLLPSGSSFMTTSRPGSASSAGELREQRRRVAVGAEPEVDQVELAELADAQLVRVRALLAPHRVRRVRGADAVEQAPRGPAGSSTPRGRAARTARRPSRSRPSTSRSASRRRRRGARSSARAVDPPDSANEKSSFARAVNAAMTRSVNAGATSSTTTSSPFIGGERTWVRRCATGASARRLWSPGS